jgi:hypothetical protein
MRTLALALLATLALGAACRADDPAPPELFLNSWVPPSQSTTSMNLSPDGSVTIKRPGFPIYSGKADPRTLAQVREGFAKAAPLFTTSRPTNDDAAAPTKPFFMFFSTDTDTRYVQGTLEKHDPSLDLLLGTLVDLEKRVQADPKNASFDSGLDLGIVPPGRLSSDEDVSVDGQNTVTVTLNPIDPKQPPKTLVGKLTQADHDRLLGEWTNALGAGDIPSMIEDPNGQKDAPTLWLSGRIGTIQIVHDGAYGDRPEFKPLVEDLKAILARVKADGLAPGDVQGTAKLSADGKYLSLETSSGTLAVANDPASPEWKSLAALDGQTVTVHAGVGTNRVLLLNPVSPPAPTRGFSGSLPR